MRGDNQSLESEFPELIKKLDKLETTPFCFSNSLYRAQVLHERRGDGWQRDAGRSAASRLHAAVKGGRELYFG
jgi:hypothetical protein